MKNLLAAALITIAPMVYSEDEPQDFCTQMEGIAASIMTYRQYDGRMSKMIRLARENNTLGVMQPIIEVAFKRPVMSYEPNKKKAITQFANDFYMACIEGDK